MIHDWVLHSEYEIANWNIRRFWQVFCKKETFAFWQLWITFVVNASPDFQFSTDLFPISRRRGDGIVRKQQRTVVWSWRVSVATNFISHRAIHIHKSNSLFPQTPLSPPVTLFTHVKETFDSNISIATEYTPSTENYSGNVTCIFLSLYLPIQINVSACQRHSILSMVPRELTVRNATTS